MHLQSKVRKLHYKDLKLILGCLWYCIGKGTINRDDDYEEGYLIEEWEQALVSECEARDISLTSIDIPENPMPKCVKDLLES